MPPFQGEPDRGINQGNALESLSLERVFDAPDLRAHRALRIRFRFTFLEMISWMSWIF